ncbi:MAG: type VI secretion system-associated FHA domain protein TagH [Paracoccaceae bacterium]
MGLTLNIQGSGVVPDGPAQIPLRGGALTIGRAVGNDLVLPDPDRVVSSRHCVIEERGNDYVLMDISTNGTFLNFEPGALGPVATPLNNGDVVQVGPYELRVDIQEAPAASTSDILADLAPPLADEELSPQGRAANTGDLPGFGGPGGGSDDFLGDLLGAGPATGPKATSLSAPPPDPAPLIPDDDDILGGKGPDPFAEFGHSSEDHTASANDYFAAPEVSGGGAGFIPDDWDLDGEDGAPAPAPEPPKPAPAAPPPAATPPPPPVAKPAAPAPAEPAPAEPAPIAKTASPAPEKAAPAAGGAAGGASVNADLAQLFFATASADKVKIDDADIAAAMERAGAAYRKMVEGLREVLMTRASIKSEFRLGQTMISPDGNNPIKFSVSADQAIEAMLRPGMPGYLPADRAADEALKDIKAHEVAMMTGMQAAITSLLKKFDPASLAGRIEGKGGLFGGKKAKYWDAFEKMYGEIAAEAEDDFQNLFGKAFAEAYRTQLKKL